MGFVAQPLIHGKGTDERAWQQDLATVRPARIVDAADLVAGCARVVVVAPHPDDELLGVGATLRMLADRGLDSLLVSVTRGEASHPGSTQWAPGEFGRRRIAERDAGLARLGWRPGMVVDAGFPDGAVSAHEGRLAELLASRLRGSDAVFTTWRRDGHPDHDATGRAVARVCAARGSTLFEFPVWMWHWATPADPRVPWSRLARIACSSDARDAKRSAIGAHASQLAPDATTGRSAILSARTLRRFDRECESVFA